MKMTESRFKDWKQAAQFLFSHLSDAQCLFEEKQVDIIKSMAYAPSDRVEDMVKQNRELQCKIDTLQEVIDLDYHDIFGDAK